MYKISELENNNFLNDDNLYGKFYLYDGIIEEMARIDNIPNTAFEIHIEGGEGYIPHMHICKKSGKSIILRINLLTNEYFREKDDRMNTLNSKERKALNNFLKTNVIGAKTPTTYWEYILLTWNIYNPKYSIDINSVVQPDYTVINEPK